MRKLIITIVAALGVALGGSSSAFAAEPTCSDSPLLGGIAVHGQHIVRDYVAGGGAATSWPPSGGQVGSAVGGSGAAIPGGPGPGFHFLHGFAPGASFCNTQSQSPGNHPG
jgi:hypothetical protein